MPGRDAIGSEDPRALEQVVEFEALIADDAEQREPLSDRRIVTPIVSAPDSAISAAATEESTPPDIATTTRSPPKLASLTGRPPRARAVRARAAA
jgi:hypothetical protein